MAQVERGIPLVERIIERLEPHVSVRGASAVALDALESKLMVELPPTLRRFLQFDFTFASFGKRWRGKHRFGRDASRPTPRLTSVRKLAPAMTELGWSDVKLRHRLIRLPNLPDEPWNALYLGEARQDGELPILGLVADETNVAVFMRYTAFDLYLVEQSGLVELTEETRLDDLDSCLSLNPELSPLVPEEEVEPPY
ncbi:MAG: SMI1/KNR4 family protein [Deltaproteobacteria bacterium]|jgi:hypothetical protein|nr:SMI1/KNR4 family protein [Deltaproteobacteria bacterium]MBW2535962.1 SMI1/KNR4 family protein [Deltaproteobacteria bacterium]